MDSPEFSDALCDLIKAAIPALEAAEILLILFRNADSAFTAEQLTHLAEPAAVSEAETAKYLETFRLFGLTSWDAGRYQYRASSDDLDQLVRQLARAYNERPVTLVRLIYTFKDARIRSFADAFKIKKE
jgi:hypothetical protein